MAQKMLLQFSLYEPDNWRVSKNRNIGALEGNKPAPDNDWETVTEGGDKKIEEWISNQMKERTCTVILVGTNTADRKWINREIIKSWNDVMGVLAIHIHNTTDNNDKQSLKGANPLSYATHGQKKGLSTITNTYDPPRKTSKGVYNYLSDNTEDWIEEAVRIRKAND